LIYPLLLADINKGGITVTLKPVLYGGIAARLARVPAVVAAVSGLGAVFIASGFRTRILRCLVIAGFMIGSYSGLVAPIS